MGRNTRPFRQIHIWRYLRKHPEGTRRGRVAEEFNLSPYAASNLLQRLGSSGCAVMGGTTRHALWYATDKRPEDQRGAHPNSQPALVKGHKQWAKGLKAAAAALGRDPEKIKEKRKPEVYEPATELERCWMLPFSRTHVSSNEAELGGEVTPAESVEAA